MSKNKEAPRSWWRKHFDDHPGVIAGAHYVESGTGRTKAPKVYCKACLLADAQQIVMDDLHAIDQGQITAVRNEHEIALYCELINRFIDRVDAHHRSIKYGTSRGQLKEQEGTFATPRQHVSIISDSAQTNLPTFVHGHRKQPTPPRSHDTPHMELRGQGQP